MESALTEYERMDRSRRLKALGDEMRRKHEEYQKKCAPIVGPRPPPIGHFADDDPDVHRSFAFPENP